MHLSRLITYPPFEKQYLEDRQIVKYELRKYEHGFERKRVEIMIPTCSYRMGVSNIGYGYAIIGEYEKRSD